MKIINQLKVVIIIATIGISSQVQAATVGIARPPQGGNTYYVSPSGSDSAAGTQAAPFKTIARGSQALSAGDTLLIRAGTYNEGMAHKSNGFKFTSGTSLTAMTRYAAYPGETVIIHGSGPAEFYIGPDTSYVEVSGITIEGTGSTILRATNSDEGTYGKERVHHVRFIGNEVRGSNSSIAFGGVNNEFIGNYVHDMRKYGIYASHNNMLIENNLFEDIDGHGIHLYKYNVGSAAPNNSIVRNNVFRRNGKVGFFHGSDPTTRRKVAAAIIRGTNNQFYNNIIYDSYAGIIVGYGATNTLIANNTVYGSVDYGINISNVFGGSSGAKVINNISFGNGRAQITNTATGTTLQNNMTTDPFFWNAAGADFGLKLLSPAIDAGVTVSEVKKDFIGTPRPVGPTYDIGAFEGSGSRPNPIPVSDGSLPGEGGSSTDPTCCI